MHELRRFGPLMATALLLACGRAPTPGTETSDTSSGEGSGSATRSSSDTGSSASSGTSESGETSTATSDESESSDTMDTSDFIPLIDVGNPNGCSPMAQDCPEGEKCVFYIPEPGLQRRDGTRCIEVTGDAQPYEPCELPTGFGAEITDTCGQDSYCLEVYTSADHGFCAPFAETFDCEAYPGSGYATENGSTFPDACLYFDCHPEVADACPTDMSCVFYPAFLYGSNFCWKIPDTTPQPLGSACDYGACGDGQLCLRAEFVPGCTEERCCTQWCNLDTPNCTDTNATCEHLGVWGGVEPAFDSLGACVVPGSLMP